MAKDIKALRKRIKSFDSTLHLTGAMGLVASSKMRKATDAMIRSREYISTLSDTVNGLLLCPECRRSFYLKSDEDDERTLLIVIAGDRGLCGGYNANIFRLVKQMENVSIIPIGKRAFDRYKDSEDKEFDSSEYYTSDKAFELANECIRRFKTGEVTRVGIVYNEYVSVMTQVPRIEWILPLVKPQGGSAAGIYEPDPLTLLEDIVPLYLSGMIMALVKEGFASEVASRRMAMDSATKNATEMIEDLTLEYNRVRQGRITQEITEIVAGAGR